MKQTVFPCVIEMATETHGKIIDGAITCIRSTGTYKCRVRQDAGSDQRTGTYKCRTRQEATEGQGDMSQSILPV